ncbi:family 20 glycosylhydrolase [Macrococcus lamae]|uniref:Beta-hexosaminidase n=1 Tax=Macrococcus lamae TaxID=198484 RepID=A0A4R6BVH5_9STAP|nr:family 20 glycosylhydrolase [Macrococcus lamae]TDM12281.1 beta-hexosaminidase [Macrococcus lamae]
MLSKVLLSFLLMSTGTYPIMDKSGVAPGADKGVNIDIARKYHSLTTLKAVVDELKRGNGTYLQLHFSDNKNYGIASPYLKQTSTKTNSKYLTSKELKELIKYSNDRSILVIPDIDMPAHSKAWLSKVKPRLKKNERIAADFDSSVVNYFDNQAAVTHSKALLSEVMKQFEQPKYRGSQRIVIGGDEVPGAFSYQSYLIRYINTLADYTMYKGYKPQIWNDSITSTGLSKLHRSLSILYWAQNGGRSNGSNVSVEEFTNKGFNVYNYNSMSLYFIPSSTYSSRTIKGQSIYIKSFYKPNRFHQKGNYYYSVTAPRISGSALSFWGEHSAGLTQKQLLAQELPLIKSYLQVR